MAGRVTDWCVLQNFRNWYSSKQPTDLETSLLPLSDGVMAQLTGTVTSLPTPQPYSETIRKAVVDALAVWQQQPEQNNALIILGSPIEPIGQYIEYALCSWPPLDERSMRILRWKAIPASPDAFVSRLRTEIGTQLKASPATETLGEPHAPDSENSNGSTSDDPQQYGIVLPELDQYFVRCIEGMEGVLYLRKEVQKDPLRFWVIGCNFWAWNYLSIVSKMDSYFDRTVPLPTLSGLDLRNWLAPARRHLKELLPHVASPDPSADATYFDNLARSANGLSSVAAQLWLSSLRLASVPDAPISQASLAGATLAGGSLAGMMPPPHITAATTDGDSIGDADSITDLDNPDYRLELARPVATKLQSLSAGDRYLLYSLLLHNGLQFWHLALSLGETESIVQARVKGLQRQGIIEQRGRNWYVRSEYYPNLRSTLANNNFLVPKHG